MKKIVMLFLSAILLLNTVFSTSIEAASVKTPDYDIWMANSLISGVDGTTSWYKTFKNLQEPIYKTLGKEVLNNKPLVSMSAGWTVFFNSKYRNQFANEQKYIYEVILMDYLKYGTSQDKTVTDITGSEYKFAQKLYSVITKDLLKKTDAKVAKNVWKNLKIAEDINKALKVVGEGKKTVKELIDDISMYLALQETRTEKVALLKASKAAAGKNGDYKKAVDDVIKAVNASAVQYAAGKGVDFLWDKTLDKAWEKLTAANPALKGIELGVAGLDACFDTSKSAANNLKLALLYTVDCYMSTTLSKASMKFTSNKTASNARNFREYFKGYVQFQMFGNKYAEKWLGQYLKGGIVKDIFNRIFKKQNIKTANDMKKRCQTQINGRNTILKGIRKCEQIYRGKYPLTAKQTIVSLNLSKKSMTISAGKTVILKATVSGTKNKVSWSSSNSKIATVKNGKVTGKKAGTAKIIAKVGGKTATCTVIVKGYVTSAKKLTKKEQHKLYESTIKSYAKSMKNGARKWNEDSGLKTYFVFVDIDKNGTDELIVRAVNSTMKQTTASTSGYGENTHIYTIKNNKVKKVLGNSTYAPTLGHVNYVRVYKNCKYIDRGFSHLPADYIFYKYSNGTLASKPTYTFTVGGWGTGTWIINGKNVSKNYCMKQLNKVSGNREGYPMHKYSASTYKKYL